MVVAVARIAPCGGWHGVEEVPLGAKSISGAKDSLQPARLLVLAVSLIASLVLGVAPARADTVQVNEQPVDGWDTDGPVYAVEIVGNTVYIGGDFSNVKGPDGTTKQRRNLAAINMPTGDVTDFRADTNGAVRALEARSGNLWLGGNFTAVQGLARDHLAVVAIASSTVRADITTSFNDRVSAIVRNGTDIYVGGSFTNVDGAARNHLVRLAAGDGSLDRGWRPNPNNSVDAIAFASAGDVAYFSGEFSRVGSADRESVAGVSTETGAVVTPQFENLTHRALAVDVTPSGDRIIAGLGAMGNRVAAWNTANGQETWRVGVGGNAQAVKYHQGNVYFGFHDNYQGNTHLKILSADAYSGSVASWRPGIPTFKGVFAIDASATHGLVAGGVFTKVEGIKTENVAIFHPLARSDSMRPSRPKNVTVTLTSDTQISLRWDPSTDNVGVTAYTVWRDGVPAGVTVDTFFNDKGNLPGQRFTYEITAGDNAANESPRTAPLSVSTTNGIISAGSKWAYLDDGSNQGTAWRQVGFNDSQWPRGNGELGFGDDDETTVLSSGEITYYFRRDFSLPTQPSSDVMMAVRRDDGAVVYINGTEVWRDNMPSGSINFNTTAISIIAGSDEDRYNHVAVPSSILQLGVNEIAVEVHQTSPGSSDLSFDLAMWGGMPLLCNGHPVTISGTTVADTIVGTTGRDVIHGLGGNDTIKGLGGNDVICGGGGDDTLIGGGGRDRLLGGAGADVLKGNKGKDKLKGNNGADRLNGGPGNDILEGGKGFDEASFAGLARPVVADLKTGISSGQGADTLDGIKHLEGSSRADVLRGDNSANRLVGGGGQDLLLGRRGSDVLSGNGGADSLSGGFGNDLLEGGNGDDELDGGPGFDTLRGGSGTDACSGGEDIAGC